MPTSTRLDVKRVLITQAQDFMGPVLHEVFARCGATVVADTRPLADQPEAPAAMVREAGHVDVLVVHLALPAPSTPAGEIGEAEWRSVFAHMVDPIPRLVAAVLPQMLARGQGWLLQTVSAAGLLSQVNAAPYSVTKHAALGFGEWLSIAHGDAGIQVSCLCPQGVLTPMLLGADSDTGRPSFLGEGALTAEAVAQCALDGLRAGQFLILPHAEVLGFWQRKGQDYERWLRGMRRLRAKVMGGGS